MKRVLSLMMALFCIVILIAMPIHAAMPPQVTPLWDNLDSMVVDMAFVGTTGTAAANATSQSGCNYMEGRITLYRYDEDIEDWVYMDEWYATSTTTTVCVDGDFEGVHGTTYKAVFEATAYRNYVGESHTSECIRLFP